MRIGSLFSGAGGLDMAVEQVFGGRTVWHCENNPAASKVLAHRWPRVLNLGDVTEVHWNALPFHIDDIPGVSLKIDVLCAGWPCQPWSSAGKQLGEADERALWPEVARAVRALRPRYVVLENVPTVIVFGELARAVGDLAACGYDAQWCCLRASDVGAPHRRERLFIVATDTIDARPCASQDCACGREPDAAGGDLRSGRSRRQTANAPARLIGGSDASVGGAGPVKLLPTPLLPIPRASSGGGSNSETRDMLLPTPRSSDCFGAGLHGVGGMDLRTAVTELGPRVSPGGYAQWGRYAPAIKKWEQVLGWPAPNPTEPNRNGNPRLNPEFSSWMMGWPAGWVTQVPGVSRNDQLKIIGNGVVPQCAAAALQHLISISEVAA